MAKSKSEKKTAGQPNAVVRYLRETRGELRKVTWPTRQESWRLTGIVLAVTIATAAFLLYAPSLMNFIAAGGIKNAQEPIMIGNATIGDIPNAYISAIQGA